MDLGLKDATAVVVGGGRGIGLAAARCLADDAAQVALVGRSRDVLDNAALDLSARGSPDAVGIVADVADEHQAQQVFDEIANRWGGEVEHPHQHCRPPPSRAVSNNSATTSGAMPSTVACWAWCTACVQRCPAAPGGLGAHRELLGAVDPTTEPESGRPTPRQGHGHQCLEEPVTATGAGRDHGERRLTRQHRLGGAGRLGRHRGRRRDRSVRPDGRDRQALRPSRAPAGQGCPGKSVRSSRSGLAAPIPT